MNSISDLIEKYGLDKHESGTPVVFFKRFTDDDDAETYTYAAVKGAYGTWYCTDGQKYKWIELCEHVAKDNKGDKSLYEMSELEPIYADPDVWGEQEEDA